MPQDIQVYTIQYNTHAQISVSTSQDLKERIKTSLYQWITRCFHLLPDYSFTMTRKNRSQVLLFISCHSKDDQTVNRSIKSKRQPLHPSVFRLKILVKDHQHTDPIQSTVNETQFEWQPTNGEPRFPSQLQITSIITRTQKLFVSQGQCPQAWDWRYSSILQPQHSRKGRKKYPQKNQQGSKAST